ncbi:hypothetical protein [Zobellia alginiliquefaciens]|uniref:hypothetical protein n=1 Tax=Zobellia alginiliquefaciens TaxID=3032586 RepID=UPI0023E47296|nr:hypothetical protein [Zobellia alginiliquefaciens]
MRLRYIGAMLLGLFLVGCYHDDDGGSSYIYVEALDAFTFEAEDEYVVGDTIFFSQKFSRYLKENGYSELLDVYETTKAEQFGYSFDLQKFSEFSNTYVSISIDSKYLLTTELDTSDYYYSNYGTIAELNDQKDAYESKVGIILPESGKFKLDFSNVQFRSQFYHHLYNENISLSIAHQFTDIDDTTLEFVVSEED